MNEFFKWLAGNPTAGNILVFTLVGVIGIFVTMYVIAFFQDREIAFWPPKIGPKPTAGQLRSQINGQALSKTLTPLEIADLRVQVRFLAGLLQTTAELDRQTVKSISQLFLMRDKAVGSRNL